MTDEISSKFKNSYKDEYDALYEAVFGEGSGDNNEESSRFSEILSSSDDEKRCRSFDDDTEENSRYETVKYGDVDDESNDCEKSRWSRLPDLLLEQIYSHLTMQERYYSSMVCQSWYRAFYLPNAWRIFKFDDKTLTRRLFNYYSGWQYMLDHLRTQLCLNRVGRHVRTLIFKPISNFYNLYEFMNMISFYAEQQPNSNCTMKGIGAHITSLQYTFPCNMASRNETRLYGTGGKLLDALKRLMGNLPSMNDLRLVDLMLDSPEALKLLDDVCAIHCLTMKKLVLVNISKTQCPLLHVGVFLNVQELIISPQSLDDDVLYLLAQTKLRHLHIVQNSYTPSDVKAVSSRAWKQCCGRSNSNIKVHLRIESTKDQRLLWQEDAPVRTILFSSPQTKLRADVIARTVDDYSRTLRTFGHLRLPRYYQPKSFHERSDSHFMYLCYNCTHLETLIVRERISTATVLLISYFARNLKRFHVRRNAVILRCDWPRNPEWSDELYEWIRTSSRSYDTTEREVSFNLGCKWTMLPDKEFNNIDPKECC